MADGLRATVLGANGVAMALVGLGALIAALWYQGAQTPLADVQRRAQEIESRGPRPLEPLPELRALDGDSRYRHDATIDPFRAGSR